MKKRTLTIEQFEKLEKLALKWIINIEKFEFNFSLDFFRQIAKEWLTKNIRIRAKKIVKSHEERTLFIKNILC